MYSRAIMIIISYNTQHNLATDHEDSTDMDMDYSTTDNETAQFVETAQYVEPAVTSIIADVDEAVREATRLVATGEVDLGAIVIDVDEAWDGEERKVAQFVAGCCSCNLGPNHAPCHSLFSPTQYSEMRDECRELMRGELDLVVMGDLRALTLRDDSTQRSSERVRSFSRFQFGGHRICLTTFCFLHNNYWSGEVQCNKVKLA